MCETPASNLPNLLLTRQMIFSSFFGIRECPGSFAPAFLSSAHGQSHILVAEMLLQLVPVADPVSRFRLVALAPRFVLALGLQLLS